MITKFLSIAVTLLTLVSNMNLSAQSPGLIVRPAGGNGVSLLNPDGNAYSSGSTSGFLTSDILESEINFKVVPVAITEPTGDIATGPSGGFTDIVTSVDGSGFYIYKSSTHIYFRLRIGNIISGSKGYSVLIDTDNKIGSSGPFSDPNYVAPSGNSPSNPGFEYEVVLQTNFQVAVFTIDGSANPGTPVTFPLSSNSQISVALSNDNGNADYFYDWVIPVTAIGSPAAIRTAVTTVTSPNSAFQGSRSDIYGINDAAYSSSSAAWEMVVNAQPQINLATFSGVTPTCTNAPVINTPVLSGTNILVAGTWNRLDAAKPSSAKITLYKNGVAVDSVTSTTGTGWSISVSSLAVGDTLYAKALSAGGSECLHSNYAVITGCVTPPAIPVLTCASTKGISGTMAVGSTISVYFVPSTVASISSNLVSNGTNLTYPTSTSFAFISNGCSGSPTLASGTYMVVATNGCNSQPRFECITSGSSSTVGLATNAIAITSPLYPFHTSISGSGVAVTDILRLLINGKNVSTITATTTTFSFTGLKLTAGDQVKILQQPASGCLTQSAVFSVSCYTQPPAITTNATGNLLNTATLIRGVTATSGGSLQLYKGIAPGGVIAGSAVTTAADGSWSVNTGTLVSGDNYYAVLTANGCTSAASAQAIVAAPAVCPSITGSYTDASTPVIGTLPASFTGTVRLYNDGVLIGSQNLSSATGWSISPAANSLYFNGTLLATAQVSGGAESNGCTGVTIGCTSPGTPVISPLNSTIGAGNNINFTVGNVSAGSWYALSNATGISFATSQYRTSVTGFSLPSKTFSVAGTYNLKLTADALTGCPASFASTIITVNPILLPVKFEDFNVRRKENDALITWRVSTQMNIQYYGIEKSSDGMSFKEIHRELPQSAGEYKYTDAGISNSARFYRIREVDADGKFSFSKTIKLETGSRVSFTVYPNPSNGNFTIDLFSENGGSGIITISDIQGRRIITKSVLLTKGQNLVLVENLMVVKGLYFLNVDADGASSKNSLIIQ